MRRLLAHDPRAGKKIAQYRREPALGLLIGFRDDVAAALLHHLAFGKIAKTRHDLLRRDLDDQLRHVLEIGNFHER